MTGSGRYGRHISSKVKIPWTHLGPLISADRPIQYGKSVVSRLLDHLSYSVHVSHSMNKIVKLWISLIQGR